MLDITTKRVQEYPLQSLFVPAALRRKGTELDREGSDAAGSLTETQETLEGLSAPDRMIKHFPHLLGEGGVVGADHGTAFPHRCCPCKGLTLQRTDKVSDPRLVCGVGLGLWLEHQRALEQKQPT